MDKPKPIIYVFHSPAVAAKCPELTVTIVGVVDKNLPPAKKEENYVKKIPLEFVPVAQGNVFDLGAMHTSRPDDVKPIGFLMPKSDGKVDFFPTGSGALFSQNIIIEGENIPPLLKDLFDGRMPTRSD